MTESHEEQREGGVGAGDDLKKITEELRDLAKLSLEEYIRQGAEISFPAPLRLDAAPASAPRRLRPDKVAKRLLAGAFSRLDVVPVQTTGDGNCLYNAASIALRGDESLAAELRLRTALELLRNYDYYRTGYADAGFDLCSDPIDEVCRHVWQPTRFSSVWSLPPLATVVGRPIRSVYPCVNRSDALSEVLDRLFAPRGVRLEGHDYRRSGGVAIVWSSYKINESTDGSGATDNNSNNNNNTSTKTWTPNHFVPLLPRASLDGWTPFVPLRSEAVLRRSLVSRCSFNAFLRRSLHSLFFQAIPVPLRRRLHISRIVSSRLLSGLKVRF